jgi:hypothetical protein
VLELKRISRQTVENALAKAERYRLLNEPREAESICRDILRADPQHSQGLVVLILAITDQFGKEFGVHMDQAHKLLDQLKDEYERAYYEGVILERWAKAQLARGTPGYIVHDWFRMAMSYFEKAEAIRPPRNDDAILRWNTCARIVNEGEPKSPHMPTPPEEAFDDEVPLI